MFRVFLVKPNFIGGNLSRDNIEEEEFNLNITEIRKLIRLVEGSSVTEIEVTEGESSVRISCHPAVAQQTVVTQTAASPTTSAVPAAPVSTPVAEPEVHSDASGLEQYTVTSPMVGTFYSAPSPDADDFVVEGQKVKKGDTLCIIEAMKLMNEIEAEYNGVVEQILVQNATPLEFGQAMFVVTPA